MIGRSDEREWVERTLSVPGAVCQLVGPPGIGKSTIARAGVQGLTSVWTSLEPVSAGSVLSVLAGTLDTPAEPNSVAAALREVDVVVFDGSEGHEEELIELVSAWRERGLSTRVLVTTQRRMPLGPVLEVGPLPLRDAVDLFVERAREVSAKGLSAETEAVEELVRRVEGWPLAVELAASRVRLFSPTELLDEDPLEVLEDQSRRGPHASLESALTRSWAHLSPEERLAASRIALVRGWFGKSGFRDVTGCGLDVLERLMDASLVRWVPVPGGRRYTLLAPVRAFALDRLPADDPARTRYAEVVLSRADELRSAVRAAGEGPAYTELRELQTDLLHLLDADTPFAARAALALTVLALAHGPVPAALGWVQRVLARPGVPADLGVLLSEQEVELLVHVRRFDDALARLEELEESVKTCMLKAWALRERDIAESRRLYERARDLSDAQGDLFDRAVSRLSLGVVLRRSEEHAEAAAVYREGLGFARRLGARRLEAVFLANLALMEADLHGYDAELRKQLQRAVSLIRESGIRRVEMQILALLAQCDVDLAHPEARDSLAAVLKLALHVGDDFTVQNTRMLLGVHTLESGDMDEAERIMEQLGPPVGSRNAALLDLLRAMTSLGNADPDGAIACLESARANFADSNLPNEVLMVDLELAAARGEPPPPLDMGHWPPGSPMRTAHAIVTHAAGSPSIPPELVDAASRSVDLRFVLALAKRSARVEVSADGSWFRTADGERVDLSRKRVLRRVLQAFAAHQGRWIPLEELLELGWPGERPTAESGRARVHVAVSELRRMGLRDALVTSPDHVASYCLRASVRD